MIHHESNYLSGAISKALATLKEDGCYQSTARWQGIAVDNTVRQDMWELMEYSLHVKNLPNAFVQAQEQIGCNIPWAEDHFRERVEGEPLNPGNEYKNWPPYKNNPKNDQSRIHDEKFSHTYMERYWPKYAGEISRVPNKMMGIRYQYGDLDDVINQLANDPTTRQAYLPVFFPEDTGALHGGRVPCTLGYWFYMRNNKLSIVYHIRACDALRHFRDDVYLTYRLLYWVLGRLKVGKAEEYWKNINLGTLSMHIGSFHVFAKERNLL